MSYTPLGESSENGSMKNYDDDGDLNRIRPSSRMSKLNRELSEPLTSTDEESSDPFYVFRQDLRRKIELVDESLAELLRIVYQTDTSVNTYELKDAKKQLKRHIKNAELTLRDVEMTVQLVESDREKFTHVDDKELHERRSLTQTSRERIEKAKKEMNAEAVRAKLLADERAKAIRRAGSDNLGATNGAERENTEFIVDSQARTSLLMQHQDETLDELDAAVTRVGYMAENIHEEIGQQNKMLTDLSDDLDKAEEELGMVIGKLAKFLQTKDRFQLCMIVTLFVTAIILFLLVLYT